VERRDLDVDLELVLELTNDLLVDVVGPVVEDEGPFLDRRVRGDRVLRQRKLNGLVERRDRYIREIGGASGRRAGLRARRQDRGQARDRDRRTSRPRQ